MSKSIKKNKPKKLGKKRDYLPYMIIIFTGLIIYSNIYNNSYHFDDQVWRNLPSVQQFDIAGMYEFAPMRVIAYITFSLNFIAHGDSVWGYFLFNILIHISSSLIIFRIVSLLGISPLLKDTKLSKRTNVIALIAALIFLVHPIQTQAVDYIYQRLASLVALFYLAGIYFSLLARTIPKKRTLFITLTVLFFMFALFTKENAATFPIALLLIHYTFYQINRKIGWKGVTFLLSLAFAVITIFYSFDLDKHILRDYTTFKGEIINSENYFYTSMRVIPFYFKLIVLPFGQSIDHDFTISNNFTDVFVLLAFGLHLLLIILSLFYLKKYPIPCFGILWFYLTISIESSIVPIRDIIFEHRLYLPLFGIALIFSFLLYQLYEKFGQKTFFIIGVFYILFLSVITYSRNKVWKDDVTLWSNVIEQYPGNARAYLARGNAELKNNNFNKALSDFDKSLELYPDYDYALANKANVYYKIGNFDEAIKFYTAAINLNPRYEQYRYNRANAYMKIGEYGSAISDYSACIKDELNIKESLLSRSEALLKLGDTIAATKDLMRLNDIDPDNIQPIMKLGEISYRSGDMENALKYYNIVITSNPNNIEAINNRATIYFVSGDYQRAANDYQKCIQISPDFIEAYKNLGKALEKQNQFQNAIKVYSEALVVNKNDFELYYLRGNAYLGAGDPVQASVEFRNALKINPGFDKAKLKLSALSNNSE